RWFNRDKLKWYEGRYGPEWLHHMRTMIDALAEGHTLEAYRNHRKTPSFSYGDIRWCLRSRQSISSEVRGVTMKPLALAMGRSHGCQGGQGADLVRSAGSVVFSSVQTPSI